jgi:uncharacterized phage protein (TIGR02218 family)
MKTITAGLDAHLASPVTTLATLWKITRRDGAVFGFTDHNRDIVFGGLRYLSDTGYTASEVQTSGQLNVDGLEVEAFFDADSILEVDVAAGRWDRARVDVMRVNYADLTQGALIQRRGETGVFRLQGGRFVAELRGLMQYLQNNVGRVYTAPCDATLGDARCGVDLGPLTVTATVTAVTSRQTFTASSLTQAAQYFQYGKVSFTSGENAGRDMEVRSFSGGVVELQLPMVGAVAVGDTFDIVPGCDKRGSTCQTKFSNRVNFRGFDTIPGIDKMLVADPR